MTVLSSISIGLAILAMYCAARGIWHANNAKRHAADAVFYAHEAQRLRDEHKRIIREEEGQ